MTAARAAILAASSLVLGAACAAAQAPFDPTRFEAEIAAFEAEDRAAAPPEGAVLCLGSSSIVQWRDTIARDLAPLTVVARGFGGSTMLDALYYVDRLVLPARPRAILLYEGDNDVALGMSPEEVRGAFDALVAAVRERLPSTRIYVISIKPSPSRWELWPDIAETNRRLRAACRPGAGLAFIDVATPMLGRDGLPIPELFLGDCLHLSEAGYALWTSVVRTTLVAGEAYFERKTGP